MKNLIKTASISDKLLHILFIATAIGSVGCVVGLGIIAVGVIFDLPPYMIGTGFENVSLGFLTISLSDTSMPDIKVILGWIAADILLTLLCLLIARKMIGAFRDILAPMKTGSPFHNTVSIRLRTLAKYTCVIGVALNIQDIFSNILMEKAYNLSSVILSDQVTHVTITNVIDLSFLFIAGIFLLLSFVFRYGEELQQLSDETL